MQSRDADVTTLPPRSRQRRLGALRAAAGLLGLTGVGISAAAAHKGGGEIAVTAGQFCLFHAAAVLGLAAIADAGAATWLAGLAGWVLTVGTLLFSGDLAAAALASWHPVPLAAPVGGFCLLAGWGLVVASGIAGFLRR